MTMPPMPDMSGNDYGNAAIGNMMASWQNAMTNVADQAARAAYNQSMLNNEGDKTALEKAKFAWQQKLDESAQTGQWNGQWNNPQEQWYTQQFGQWYGPGGEPGVGTQTLAAQQQAASQAYNWSNAFGQYYAPGTTPDQGMQTQAAQQQAANIAAQQAGLTGWLYSPAGQTGGIGAPGGAAGQPTQTLAGQQQGFSQNLQTEQEARAAQAQQQSQAQAYLQLLSSLRGPADWAKYQQVLGSTPGGMRDLVAAAMGQYTPGGGATTGMQPQAVSLQSMMGDVSGQPDYGQGGGQLNMPNVYQGGQGSYGQQPQQGQAWVAVSVSADNSPRPTSNSRGSATARTCPLRIRSARRAGRTCSPASSRCCSACMRARAGTRTMSSR